MRRVSPGQQRPRTQFRQAATTDPDEYQIDSGYDSDDYDESFGLNRVKVVPPPSSKTSQKKHVKSAPEASRHSHHALKNGWNIFLLFGAAIDRFVSQMQAAMLAALSSAFMPVKKRTVLAATKVKHSFTASSAGKSVRKWRQNMDELQKDLPEDTWGKLLWLWDRPPVQRLRLTVSMANLSIRLPALLALVATQVGLLASQVSLPMLAPLLLGTGMLLRSIKANASFLFPRIGLLVVMLWLLWFANSVVQNTVAYLRKQNALDDRLAGGIITISECSALLVAMVVLLSMLGVNVSALLLPAGIAVAVAAKDLAHNFLAGFFLFVVQPFKLGDRLAVTSSLSGTVNPSPGGWFEGVCERVDLRYTIVRQGRRRLVIPNSAFLTREFMVLDEVTGMGEASPPPSGPGERQHQPQPFLTNDHRHVWQYVEGPPVHQELQGSPPSEVPSHSNTAGVPHGPQVGGDGRDPLQRGGGEGSYRNGNRVSAFNGDTSSKIHGSYDGYAASVATPSHNGLHVRQPVAGGIPVPRSMAYWETVSPAHQSPHYWNHANHYPTMQGPHNSMHYENHHNAHFSPASPPPPPPPPPHISSPSGLRSHPLQSDSFYDRQRDMS